MSNALRVPGIRREEFLADPRAGFRTGVPVFLGHAGAGPAEGPVRLTRWSDFRGVFPETPADGYLEPAVEGFFRNGGEVCYVLNVVPGSPDEAPLATLRRALGTLEREDAPDLVCAPELMQAVARAPSPSRQREEARAAALEMQKAVLQHCDRTGDRFALLDSVPGAGTAELLAQRRALLGLNGALYYPWLRTDGGAGLVPPCGHVAGTYAGSDLRVGVHKAPANERLEGVLDLEVVLDDGGQAELNEAGVNCLRAFPGRGIRVWGARTLVPVRALDPDSDWPRTSPWQYVSARRVFLALGRWIARTLPHAVFEPNDPRLWARITRELGGHLAELYRRGALQGRTPQEAFYVRCDAATNPPEVREAGLVVTEVGIAPTVPNEFVVVRFTHGAGGVDISGPAGPA